MGTCEGISYRVRWGSSGRIPHPNKIKGLAMVRGFAFLAAKLAAAAALLMHRALANDADFSVILLKASSAAEGVARLVGLSLELATAAGVAAVMADKPGGVNFERIGREIHWVRLSTGSKAAEREGAPPLLGGAPSSQIKQQPW
jgi:hypothetical protein